jgi:prephenate dehydrogenase
MQWEKITLAGVGLLGGSLGLAVKRAGLAGQVAGCVRRPESIKECQDLGIVDSATTDLVEAVQGAGLIVLCTPLAQMKSLAEQMLPHLEKNAVVTDVGSVKSGVVRELEPLLASHQVHFIGSHPLAGAERTGPGAARHDLFENAVSVVTPTPQSDDGALQSVLALWKAVGARTLTLSPELHDELVSRSSHLPHIVAAELANYILSPVHPKEQPLLCANGFRDSTRIALGSPGMWRDIVMANRENLTRVLSVFIENLQEFQISLQNKDSKAVLEFFQLAQERREQWRNKK